jgi:hypothetical protein
MNSDDGRDYWKPARDFIRIYCNHTNGNGVTAAKYLGYLLGLDYPVSEHWRTVPLDERLKHTLKALNGPHRVTILKALQARAEDKTND